MEFYHPTKNKDMYFEGSCDGDLTTYMDSEEKILSLFLKQLLLNIKKQILIWLKNTSRLKTLFWKKCKNMTAQKVRQSGLLRKNIKNKVTSFWVQPKLRPMMHFFSILL